MDVLIVEDELEVAEIIKELIETRLDAKVEVTNNGLDGFLACQKTKYKLIIADHEMPFMKGTAMVIALRTRENLNKGTSIIMLSAFINDQMREKLGLTNIEFISKPFTDTNLLESISPYLV